MSRVDATSVAMTTSVLPTPVEEAGSTNAVLIPGVVVGVVLAVVLLVVVVAIVLTVCVVQWKRKNYDLSNNRIYKGPPDAYSGERFKHAFVVTALHWYG